jgi:hypothetical protein
MKRDQFESYCLINVLAFVFYLLVRHHFPSSLLALALQSFIFFVGW